MFEVGCNVAQKIIGFRYMNDSPNIVTLNVGYKQSQEVVYNIPIQRRK